MGKEKNPRRVAENEAMAKTRMLRTSRRSSTSSLP
jgi:large subunit ribosomal protein L22